MTFINYAVDQDYPCTKVSDNNYGVHDVFSLGGDDNVNINHYASINATADKKVTLIYVVRLTK